MTPFSVCDCELAAPMGEGDAAGGGWASTRQRRGTPHISPLLVACVWLGTLHPCRGTTPTTLTADELARRGIAALDALLAPPCAAAALGARLYEHELLGMQGKVIFHNIILVDGTTQRSHNSNHQTTQRRLDRARFKPPTPTLARRDG